MTYIEQKQQEAKIAGAVFDTNDNFLGFQFEESDLDNLIETTIKDTLQTLLDSEELVEKDRTNDTLTGALENAHKAGFNGGHNTAITAIRAKITKLMK